MYFKYFADVKNYKVDTLKFLKNTTKTDPRTAPRHAMRQIFNIKYKDEYSKEDQLTIIDGHKGESG